MLAQSFENTSKSTDRVNLSTRIKRWLLYQYHNIIIAFLVFILAFVFFFPAIVIFIPAGHGGILWKRFAGGTQIIPALAEGVNVIWPWDKIEIYDMRLREDTQTYFSIIANDGLAVNMELTLRYRLRPATLGKLHKLIGPKYNEIFIMPEVNSVLREVVSLYKADELYAFRRQRIQEEIYEAIQQELMYRGIVGAPLSKAESVTESAKEIKGYILVQDILIRAVDLPAALLQSIEQKVQQDQLAQEYNFRLRREGFEAQRKQIEASGIQSFQDIVNDGLTDNFLRWRGVEATLDLARASTPKVILIGNGEQGLPVIFNSSKASSSIPIATLMPTAQAVVENSVPVTASQAPPTMPVLPPQEQPVQSAPQPLIANAAADFQLGLEERKNVQRKLNALGIKAGMVDGHFGALTLSAVKTWRQRNGRTETGNLTTTEYMLLLGLNTDVATGESASNQ